MGHGFYFQLTVNTSAGTRAFTLINLENVMCVYMYVFHNGANDLHDDEKNIYNNTVTNPTPTLNKIG